MSKLLFFFYNLYFTILSVNFIKDKENPNTWLCLLRSKLIRVENFEAYFKKQHADSNCGFAEEYEVRGSKCYVFHCFMFFFKVGKLSVFVLRRSSG